MIEEFEDSLDLNQINNIEFDIEEDLLSNETQDKISTYIVHEACRIYHIHFRNNLLPLTFVEFIFSEYKRYPYNSSPELQEYFKNFSYDNIENIVDIYTNSLFSVIVKKTKKFNQIHYKTIQNIYSKLSLSESNLIDFKDKSINTNLNNVTAHLYGSDEILTVKELYENYLVKKELKNYTKKTQKASTNSVTTKEETTPNPYLIGETSELPNQKGKVVKVYFPKLALPGPYPMSQEKSRINSEHRAMKFLKIDKQIELMNKHNINGVKYKQAFIDKRKAAQKPPRRKFDFDF